MRWSHPADDREEDISGQIPNGTGEQSARPCPVTKGTIKKTTHFHFKIKPNKIQILKMCFHYLFSLLINSSKLKLAYDENSLPRLR